MSRKAPKESATLYSIGHKKTGLDGNKWIIIQTVNGIKRWKLHKTPVTHVNITSSRRKSSRRKSTTTKNVNVVNQKKYHDIVFTEPTTYRGPGTSFMPAKTIRITNDFYKILLKAPLSKKGNQNNAYVFGKKYPLSEYKKIATHGNDVAQTGFIDLSLWKKHKFNNNEKKISSVTEKYGYRYDIPALVKEVRNLSNGTIIFQGETVGGDVGADLYAHKNHKNEIDSLIIDNFYYFKPANWDE